MRPLTWLLLAAGFTGCGWENLPDQSYTNLGAPLWSPEGILPVPGGLLVPLPYAGKLAFVGEDGESKLIPLGESTLHSLHPSPSGDVVGVLADEWICTFEDPRDTRGVENLDDCPDSRRTWDRKLSLLEGDQLSEGVPVPPWLDTLTWSPNGRMAIGWLDLSSGTAPRGVVNLTAVQVLDVETGALTAVTVGFAPEHVLYSADSGRAVVLSQSRVAVVDLGITPPKTEVIFPLTLSPDQVVTPIGVSLTPDGRYALIPVVGSSDMYVLDLEAHSINLVSLSGNATAVHVNVPADKTVIVYGGRAAVDLVDHAFFDVQPIALDEPMRHIIDLGEQVLLWSSTGPRDLYRLDPGTDASIALVEYRMQSSPSGVHVAPTGSHAVVFTAGSGTGTLAGLPGMEIIDLQDERGRSTPYLLESPGVAVAWADEGVRALVLQRNADYIYDLDLLSGGFTELPLPGKPSGLWRVPGGDFAIAIEGSAGRIAFADASGVETSVAEGFALLGGLDRPAVRVEVE